MSRAVLVPGVLALLPEYAGQQDPVADLRAACTDAVAWVAEDGPVEVLASPQGRRVAESLLGERSRSARWRSLLDHREVDGRAVLAVGNGSARRTEKAPGHVDERAVPFDTALGEALVAGRLGEIDLSLAAELWADTDAIAALARLLPAGLPARIDHEADPFGVCYWVARWEW